MLRTDGTLAREVELPGIGAAGGFGGRRRDSETFYSFASFNQPPTTYRLDLATGKSTEFRRTEIDFDPSRYEVEQVFYTSKDGTRVPMFITHRKGAPRDGSQPTLLYGYGGFNASMTPWFSPVFASWLELGGTLAVANLRGGGEYGREWHEAGKKLRKQNVFDDFIAAAEYLVSEKWTSPSRLAIQGGSNGGLLIGAVMTQRPELFGAALPAVGVMDMLRFQRFTAGLHFLLDQGSDRQFIQFDAFVHFRLFDGGERHAECALADFISAFHGFLHGVIEFDLCIHACHYTFPAVVVLFLFYPAFNFATVTPSPPSVLAPSSNDLTYECPFNASRTAWRNRPVPLPWMMRTNGNPARYACSR
jgi:predicted esterase